MKYILIATTLFIPTVAHADIGQLVKFRTYEFICEDKRYVDYADKLERNVSQKELNDSDKFTAHFNSTLKLIHDKGCQKTSRHLWNITKELKG